MTHTALRDAFIAGYHACENHAPNDIPSDQDIVRKFDHWYQSALTTLDRSPSEWIEWDGSADMPPGVEPDTLVEVKFGGDVRDEDLVERWYWRHVGDGSVDIHAYRVVRT